MEWRLIQSQDGPLKFLPHKSTWRQQGEGSTAVAYTVLYLFHGLGKEEGGVMFIAGVSGLMDSILSSSTDLLGNLE